jgi:hypothetical protein
MVYFWTTKGTLETYYFPILPKFYQVCKGMLLELIRAGQLV